MFDIIRNHAAQLERLDALVALQAFAQEHREALLNAAEWLGGISGTRSGRHALDSLHAVPMSPRRVLRLFENLLALLMLENVGDPGREEAVCFALIHPEDPRVAEVCLLAEGLAARVEDCREAGLGDSAEDARRAAA